MITVVGWFGPATNTRGLFLLDLGLAEPVHQCGHLDKYYVGISTYGLSELP